MEKKICKRCNEEKDISDFPYGKSYCKPCQNWFCREYKRKNREKISAYNKQYKAQHKEDISAYNSRYNKENRNDIQKRQTKQHKERRSNDENYKIACRIRGVLNKFINNNIKTMKYLGCDKLFFLNWLEYNFDENMSHDNHGKYWSLDHIIPVSYFDLTKEEQIYQCFNWSNIRPIIAINNQKRVNYLEKKEYEDNRLKVNKFIENYEVMNNVEYFDYDIDEFLRNNKD